MRKCIYILLGIVVLTALSACQQPPETDTDNIQKLEKMLTSYSGLEMAAIVPITDEEVFSRESERIAPIVRAFTDKYSSNPYLSSIGTGVRRGPEGDEIAIVVGFKKNLPDKLPDEHKIPQSFMGVPVVTVGTEEASLCT